MDKKEGKENESEEVIVIVNGKKLPIGNFPKEIIKKVAFAMVSSLKGGEEAEEIEIKICKKK